MTPRWIDALVSPPSKLRATRPAHRQRQVAELRRFVLALGDDPDVPLITAMADRLKHVATSNGLSDERPPSDTLLGYPAPRVVSAYILPFADPGGGFDNARDRP